MSLPVGPRSALAIDARELRRLALDVDDVHHEAMRGFAERTADLHADAARRSRRSFLGRVGAVSAGGALGGVTGGTLVGPARPAPAGAQPAAPADTALAGFAQSVELAAVQVYARAAAVLSPEVRPVGELFASHHQQHADAFGRLAGGDAVTVANPALLAALGPALSGLTDQVTALALARTVENQATSTYAFALTALRDPALASATATILPIEAQHATVLSIALGRTDPAQLFPTGAFEVAAVGDGTDPATGLDPVAFPAG